MEDRLLNRSEVLEKLGGISVPTLYRYIKKENFPKPIKLTEHCARWRLSWVTAFIDSKDPYLVGEA